MKALQTTALVVLLLVAIAALLIGAGSVAYFARSIESLSDFQDFFDEAYSQLTEAGIDYPPLRPDDPFLQTRRILITEGINERTAKDVVQRLFLLDSLDTTAPIDLYISTQGGWDDSAFTIIDAMLAISAPVNTHAIGGCYSAGTMILTAGTGRRTVTPNGVVSVHVTSEEPESEGEFASEPLLEKRVENLFRTTAKLPEDWYPMVGENHYYLSPQQALEFGVIDAIEAGSRSEKPAP